MLDNSTRRRSLPRWYSRVRGVRGRRPLWRPCGPRLTQSLQQGSTKSVKPFAIKNQLDTILG
jgi:hypothetical protein